MLLLCPLLYTGFLHLWMSRQLTIKNCQILGCNGFILNFEITEDTGKMNKPSLGETQWKSTSGL